MKLVLVNRKEIEKTLKEEDAHNDYAVINGVKASEEYIHKVEAGKREEIDRILEKDLSDSVMPFENIDCVNADLDHKTKTCMNCLTTYKEGETFCRKCLGKLDDIDTPILDIIFQLNKKGYITEFCCSGHPTSKLYSAYFVVSGIFNGIIVPDGFGLECEDNRTTITSLVVNEDKSKVSTAKLEELAKKNLRNLRKWVEDLPENY